MKNLVYCCLMFLLIYSPSCNSKDKYSQITVIEFSFDNLKGKGDTVEIGYLSESGKLVKRIFRSGNLENRIEKTHLFNSFGKEISVISNYNNEHVFRTDRIIDKYGFDQEVKTYELGIGDTATTIFLNNYNKDSSVIVSNIFFKGDSAMQEIHEDLYDSKKHLLQRTIKDATQNNKLVSIEKFKYDSEGNNTYTYYQTFSDSLISESTYLYNKKKLLKETHLKNGMFDSEVTYNYKNDRIIEAIKITSAKKKYSLKYFYE